MKREEKNVLSALLLQFVTLICGLIGPRLFMEAYGAEVYGASVAIAQFLSCVSLLEAGMGAVARAELYDAFAKGEQEKIAGIYNSMRRFFKGVLWLFLFYSLALALGFHDLASLSLWDRSYTFALVMVMALSAMSQHTLGISDVILLHADRRHYAVQLSYALCLLLNTLGVFVFTAIGCSILFVKGWGAMVFLLRPILLRSYRKNCFPYLPGGGIYPLQQKAYGFGQHAAYFLHRNTDILLLTLLADLKSAAIYSVYLMVGANLRNICLSFSTGMEGEFGKKCREKQQLQQCFFRYEKRMCRMGLLLFGVAAVLIDPFIKLYTKGLQDADYHQPFFALLLLSAELQYCLLQPYYALPVAMNRLKETRMAAYAEALINIVASCLFMQFWEPLCALAAGTILAQSVRAWWLRKYISKEIFPLSSLGVQLLPMVGIWLLSAVELSVDTWLQWIVWGILWMLILGSGLFGREGWNVARGGWKR